MDCKFQVSKRLFHGGLPQPLLVNQKDAEFYREWMDSFFARDIQKVFAFRYPEKFTASFEYVLKRSGGLFETTKGARALGISRSTLDSHIQALAATHAVKIARPFFGGGQKELTKMPKIYAFDTGFVPFSRGWDPLRPDDYGPLWEHIVLEYLQANALDKEIQYWRDTSGREVDFVMSLNRNTIDAISCKWDPRRFETTALKAFREWYPNGNNYLICPDAGQGYQKSIGSLDIMFCNPRQWLDKYSAS